MASYPYKNWMASCSAAQHLTVAEFCFPGTHDSGCYGNIDFTPVVDSSKIATSEERFAPAFQAIAKRWTITQPGNSLYLQLCHGVRYLDIRVGYCADDKTYYLVHTFAVAKLRDALADIKQFTEENPTEVIILDVQPRYDIDDDSLASLVESYVGPYMYADANLDGTFPDTIGDMVKNKKTVVCIYHLQDPSKEKRPSPLWYKGSQCLFDWPFTTIDSVSQKETYLIPKINSYLAARKQEKVPRLFHLPLTLTETDGDVEESVFTGSSLRTLASKMDADIQRYVFDVLSGEQRRAVSIISVDYECTSKLLPCALSLNQEKLAERMKEFQAVRPAPDTPPMVTSHYPRSNVYKERRSKNHRSGRGCWRWLRRRCPCACACQSDEDDYDVMLKPEIDTW